ncbi:MAG: beta-propeller fold lactonase family protein [bacterium]|jgi:WD40 repeat protein
MAYTKTNWTEATAITTARLNKMETQYDEAAGYADAKRADADEILKCEIVATLPTAAQAHAGRIIFNLEDGQFYGGTGVNWVPIGAGGIEFPGQTEVEAKLGDNVSKHDLVIRKLTATPVADPSTLPGGTGQGVAIAVTNDGTFIAVAHNGTPYITIYRLENDVLSKISDPSTLHTGTAFGVAFSPSGTYLAVAHLTTPFITIYKRSGSTFTKLPNPASLPAGAGQGIAFSPDETYLVIGHASAPYITIYKRSDDTFTKLPNPEALPTGTGYGVGFSRSGVYLVIGHASAPYITIYKRSGDTFTKLPNPEALPSNECRGVLFTRDDTMLIVGTGWADKGLIVYQRSGDVFTKLDNGAIIPNALSLSIASGMASIGEYLIVTQRTSSSYPPLRVFKYDGNAYRYINELDDEILTACYDVKATDDGSLLAAAFSDPPHVRVYKDIGEAVFLSGGDFGDIMGVSGAGYAMESGSAGEVKRVMMLWK